MTQDRAERLAKQGYQHENCDTKVRAKERVAELKAQGYEAVIERDSYYDHRKGRTVYFYEVWFKEGLERRMRTGMDRLMEASPEMRGAVEAARRLHNSLHTGG